MISESRWDIGLPALLLAAAAVLGGGIGLAARPCVATTILVAAAVQLAVSVLIWRIPRRPVLAAGMITLVTLGVALDPTMRDLLREGAVPWIALAHALGTRDLVRRARTELGLATGLALLATALAGVVTVSVQGGIPIVPAVLASSVPILGGALVATVQQLERARQDRLSRGTGGLAASGRDQPDAARQALLLVALRAEILLRDAPDDTAVAQARDLRTVALQGLNVPAAASHTGVTVRIDIPGVVGAPSDEASASRPVPQPARTALTSPTAPTAPTSPTSPPTLSEREREIVRLLVTGASNAQIARDLYLSEATVKGHVSRLMRRLGCDNRTQLALLATTWSGEIARPEPRLSS